LSISHSIVNLSGDSFGELALLFPNTDVDMVMFGASAYNLARQAKPSAIAARQYAYEYRAAEQCGSGSIRIQLYKESAIWDPDDILPREMIPDVLIGLNAGMSAFSTWNPVFLTSRQLSIPFAITEFGRLSLAEDRYHFGKYVDEARTQIERDGLFRRDPERGQAMIKSVNYQPSAEINPFMRPGRVASITNRVPNAVNGFSCIVTPGSETE
jgi:hypothetical protein